MRRLNEAMMGLGMGHERNVNGAMMGLGMGHEKTEWSHDGSGDGS